jgi:hypothetical protein
MEPLGHDEIPSPFSNMKYVETEDGDETGAFDGVDVGVLDGCNVGGDTIAVGEIVSVLGTGPESVWSDLQIICVFAFAPQPVVMVL